jgi:galactose mutarotase-like enzyme
VGGDIPFNEHYLTFEKPEQVYNIVKSYGPRDLIGQFFSDRGRTLGLDYDMFAKGAFCFRPVNSSYVVLRNRRNTRSLTLRAETLTHLQFWAEVGGDFICMEPFYGSITSIPPKPEEGIWKERSGTLRIAPGEEFSCAYYVTIAK